MITSGKLQVLGASRMNSTVETISLLERLPSCPDGLSQSTFVGSAYSKFGG